MCVNGDGPVADLAQANAYASHMPLRVRQQRDQLLGQRQHGKRTRTDHALLHRLQGIFHICARISALFIFGKDGCAAVKLQRRALSLETDVHDRFMVIKAYFYFPHKFLLPVTR